MTILKSQAIQYKNRKCLKQVFHKRGHPNRQQIHGKAFQFIQEMQIKNHNKMSLIVVYTHAGGLK